jgi:predicted ATPase
MNPKNFFGELKRRHVYKVAVAYAIVAWLLIQIATQVFPFLEIPNWVVRAVIVLVVVGFPIALVIAWAFELTPEGIKRAADIDLRANPRRPRETKQLQAELVETERNNLPAQLSSFIGRESEGAEIKKLLARSRLLTLTGAGGCGKTRLALRVAGDLLSDYSDGVWLVELAPASDPEMVIQITAEVLGIREQPKRSLVETLRDGLRSKRILLVLDNCEHLLDACANLAGALLKTCINLRILATSRQAIGVTGESVWQVLPLTTPAAGATTKSLESLSQFEAVRLFRDRAVAVQPRFALTAATAPAVAQICWRVEGIPLAIELAAARVSALSVVQIADRLQDSFQLLSHGKRTALPHHQALRATIDWSYALLTDAERTLFQRLSVFTGGFDLEAAENVCVGEGMEHGQLLDLLTQLVEKSLVLIREKRGTMRYRMLEPIRHYARDRLRESGAVTSVQGRHAYYFLRLAQETEPRLLGPEQQLAFEELEVEHANLLAALARAVEHDPGSALKLSNALGWFWERRSYLAQGREWFERSIAQSPATLAHLRAEAYVRVEGGSHGSRANTGALMLSPNRACVSVKNQATDGGGGWRLITWRPWPSIAASLIGAGPLRSKVCRSEKIWAITTLSGGH